VSGPARRLLGAAFVYGLGGLLSRLASLLLLPLFTSFLTPADYGVLAMLGIMSTLLSGAVALGTGASVGICFHEAPERDRTSVIWSMSAVVLLSATAWVLIGSLARHAVSRLLFQTPSYGTAVTLALLQLAASSAAQPILSRWRMEERPKPFAIATTSLTIATLLGNAIAVAGLRRGLMGMLWSTMLVQVGFCLVLYAVLLKSSRLEVRRYWAGRLIRLGWPSALGVGAFFALDFGDRIILERLAGLSAVGIYNIGVSLGLGMSILVDGAFGGAWPGFFLSYANRQEEAREVFGNVLYYYVIVFLTICGAVFLFARPVVELLTKPSFHSAYRIVGFIALCAVLKGVYLIFLPGLYFHKKLQVQTTLEWVGASVGLGTCLLLIPRFGIFGAVMGPLTGYAMLCACTVTVARRYLFPRIAVRRLLLVIALFAMVAATSFIRLSDVALLEWAWRTVALVTFAGLVWVSFVDHSVSDIWRTLRPGSPAPPALDAVRS
jgi:O-antigen/teichoic acid export membrane protein